MALVQVGHDNTLPFRDRAVDADELALTPHRVDLVESKLVL